MQFVFIPLFSWPNGAELILLVCLFLMLFGASRIPKMMRNLGKGVHAFKQGIADAQEEIKKPVEKTSNTDDDTPVIHTAKAKDVD